MYVPFYNSSCALSKSPCGASSIDSEKPQVSNDFKAGYQTAPLQPGTICCAS